MVEFIWDVLADLGTNDVVLNVVDPLVQLCDVHLSIFSTGVCDLQSIQKN